jgi:hypothetical protein
MRRNSYCSLKAPFFSFVVEILTLNLFIHCLQQMSASGPRFAARMARRLSAFETCRIHVHSSVFCSHFGAIYLVLIVNQTLFFANWEFPSPPEIGTVPCASAYTERPSKVRVSAAFALSPQNNFAALLPAPGPADTIHTERSNGKTLKHCIAKSPVQPKQTILKAKPQRPPRLTVYSCRSACIGSTRVEFPCGSRVDVVAIPGAGRASGRRT